MTEKDWGRATTSLTTFEILQTLRELDGAGVTELADHLDFAKSTVHRHLATLHDAEYVVKRGNTYHVGLRFVELGEHARLRDPAFEMAREKVNQLAEETGERAQFIVEEHGYGVYVFTALGSDHAVQTDAGEGKRLPLNSISAGKAILAEFSEERVREIIDKHGLQQRTGNTITNESALFEELDEIRERGYALNFQESTEGLRAVSVPISPSENTVIGAFGISGPVHRFKGSKFTEELPNLLLGAANELELDLQYY